MNPTCPVCHQPVSPEYYFCPNCGAELREAPLPTDAWSQAKLYAFSLVLPAICYLAISKWKGAKYLKSRDPKAKQIGATACFLIVLSTLFTIWYAYVWTQQEIQSSLSSLNIDNINSM